MHVLCATNGKQKRKAFRLEAITNSENTNDYVTPFGLECMKDSTVAIKMRMVRYIRRGNQELEIHCTTNKPYKSCTPFRLRNDKR